MPSGILQFFEFGQITLLYCSRNLFVLYLCVFDLFCLLFGNLSQLVQVTILLSLTHGCFVVRLYFGDLLISGYCFCLQCLYLLERDWLLILQF
jgi:hypothetical protein